MATKYVGCGHIGIAWQQLLATWDQYATGTYSGWDFDVGSYSGFWYVHVNLYVSGVVADDFYFLDLSARDSYKAPLQYPLGCPGWTGILQSVYPDTLPDSMGAVSAYDAGPATARKQMWQFWCGPGAAGGGHLSSGGSFGVVAHSWHASYSFGTVFVTDQHGILVGTPTIDSFVGTATNFRGDGSIAVSVSGGGGGSIDLTPVVEAIESIADKDVDWKANEGGSTWSIYSRVTAE